MGLCFQTHYASKKLYVLKKGIDSDLVEYEINTKPMTLIINHGDCDK
jgi:hypothetical protein